MGCINKGDRMANRFSICQITWKWSNFLLSRPPYFGCNFVEYLRHYYPVSSFGSKFEFNRDPILCSIPRGRKTPQGSENDPQ
jgi:hypothetical protein